MSWSHVDDKYAKFGQVVSSDLAVEMKRAMDYLLANDQIGEICPIMTNIPGVESPDPNIFQLCNGSEITNPNSPLRSMGGVRRYTPNLVGEFIRLTTNLGLDSTSYGDNYMGGLDHNHGGRTGRDDPAPIDLNDTEDDDWNVASSHSHTIATSFFGIQEMIPSFVELRLYMKIQ